MSEALSEQFLLQDKLTQDIKAAAKTLTVREARYLTDLYYQFQDNRIRAAGQIRSMVTDEVVEPHETLDWVMSQSEKLEISIRSVLGEFAKNRIVGAWSQSIHGIGPVISAGLIANISMRVWVCMASDEEKETRRKREEQCTQRKPCSMACHEKPLNTAGMIWRYAGLDPTVKWEKGKKRPWNASLKRLCFLIGECFVKVSNSPKDFYGHFYRQRKEQEIAKNDRGEFAEQAARVLREKNIGKSTDAYKAYSQGKLPPAHIHRRACRYCVKLFLAHWHAVAYRAEFERSAPAPYAMSELGHTDYIQPPNYPWPAELKKK
jgi:hypothetical protein